MSLRTLITIFLIGSVFFLVAGLSLYVFRQTGWLTTERTSVSLELQAPQTATQTNSIVPSQPSSTPTPITLIFVGDMMFDRHIRVNAQKRGGYEGTISPGLLALFAQADVVVGNLEGPITNNPSKSVGSAVGSPANYLFTFDPAVVAFLSQSNIHLVNLGNNHILNFGQAGLEETYRNLDQGDIAYFGATGKTDPYQRWYSTTINDIRFAFVNYNQFTPDGYQQALEDLTEVREAHDVVILYPHWGNEYVPENATLKEQARAFVAAGADLIVGSHPHVVTGNEVVDGTKIYYSLGNFIFDQYFEPAVKQGLVVQASYDQVRKEFTFAEIPVVLTPDGVTALLDEQ